MLKWKRGWVDSAQAIITMEASTTLVAGDLVTFIAPDALGELPQAGKLTGGDGDTSRPFGVALHGALDTQEVMVRMILPGDVWIADAAAATVVARIGELCAFDTSQDIIVTTGSLGCARARIVGIEGALADQTYLIMFEPADYVDLSVPYIQRLVVSESAAGGLSFTVTERIRIVDVIVEPTADAASSTLQLQSSGDVDISSAIACAAIGTIGRTTSIAAAAATVTKGGSVKVLAEAGTPANARGIVTIIGVRL